MTPAQTPLHIVLAAHGSTEHDGSAAMVRACADAITRSGIASGVVLEAFLRGGPLALRDALDVCPAGDVLILPLLMNDGWFAEVAFPRELDAERPRPHLRRVTLHPPLGLDPRFPRWVLASATQAAVDVQARRVLIVGHGTERDTRSARRTYEIASELRELITAQNIIRTIDVAFLDQEPRLGDVLQTYDDDEPLLVLPWFAADGMHASIDIPALIAQHRPQNTALTTSVGCQAFPVLAVEIVQQALHESRL